MKFNELSSLLKGNRRVEELTTRWETFSEQGPAQPSSILSAGKIAAAPDAAPSHSGPPRLLPGSQFP